jgi:hypothetical protein
MFHLGETHGHWLELWISIRHRKRWTVRAGRLPWALLWPGMLIVSRLASFDGSHGSRTEIQQVRYPIPLFSPQPGERGSSAQRCLPTEIQGMV